MNRRPGWRAVIQSDDDRIKVEGAVVFVVVLAIVLAIYVLTGGVRCRAGLQDSGDLRVPPPGGIFVAAEQEDGVKSTRQLCRATPPHLQTRPTSVAAQAWELVAQETRSPETAEPPCRRGSRGDMIAKRLTSPVRDCRYGRSVRFFYGESDE